MIYRPLGRTGIEASLIALGTVKLGRNTAVKYPEPFALPSDAEARSLLAQAHTLGVNLLDTAPAYGSSEERLGRLIQGERDHWLLCSKVGETFDGSRSRYAFDEPEVRASVNRSLKHLKTDRLDVLLIHSDGRDREILEEMGTMEVLQRLRHEGKARAIGMSVKSADGLRAAIHAGADVVMATLNSDYLAEREAIAEAGRSQVGVLVKKALASGHRRADELQFVATQPGVSSVVVGTINAEHLLANCLAVAG